VHADSPRQFNEPLPGRRSMNARASFSLMRAGS
jgi:hypothetical protein